MDPNFGGFSNPPCADHTCRGIRSRMLFEIFFKWGGRKLRLCMCSQTEAIRRDPWQQLEIADVVTESQRLLFAWSMKSLRSPWLIREVGIDSSRSFASSRRRHSTGLCPPSMITSPATALWRSLGHPERAEFSNGAGESFDAGRR